MQNNIILSKHLVAECGQYDNLTSTFPSLVVFDQTEYVYEQTLCFVLIDSVLIEAIIRLTILSTCTVLNYKLNITEVQDYEHSL